MLSVLIPTYNYNTYTLVVELHKQCLECKIDFEIIVQDDASNSDFNYVNQKINSLDNCFYSTNETNLGRGRNINALFQKSKFEWLLILDCDTFPANGNFIKKYIESTINSVVIFGGIIYQNDKPPKQNLLRWVYGKKRESIPTEKRKLQEYQTTLTSNILIKSEVFASNLFNENISRYGYEDLIFIKNFRKKKIFILHIDNPTFHLNLETSIEFVKKTETALSNFNWLLNNQFLTYQDSKLGKSLKIIDSLRGRKVIGFIFLIFKKPIMLNLTSNNPNLVLFDIYKLGFLCNLKK